MNIVLYSCGWQSVYANSSQQGIHERPTTSMLSISCYIYVKDYRLYEQVFLEHFILQKQLAVFWGTRIPFLCFTNKTRPNNAWRWMWAKMQIWIILHTLCFLYQKRLILLYFMSTFYCFLSMIQSMQNLIHIGFHMRSNNTQNFMLYLLNILHRLW
jgi:hypothetical protein